MHLHKHDTHTRLGFRRTVTPVFTTLTCTYTQLLTATHWILSMQVDMHILIQSSYTQTLQRTRSHTHTPKHSHTNTETHTYTQNAHTGHTHAHTSIHVFRKEPRYISSNVSCSLFITRKKKWMENVALDVSVLGRDTGTGVHKSRYGRSGLRVVPFLCLLLMGILF